jgi:ATP-binding cassette subfamily F protein uup
VEAGDTIVLGVYDQLGLTIEDPEQTVLDFVLQRVRSRIPTPGSSTGSEILAPDEARRLLRKFEFPKQRWDERVSVLSGGEKRRLQMLSVLSQRPNFLVMDEPSVDCDLDTLQALETYLQEEFDGVLLIVSHDRSFADKVSDHLFVFQGAGEVVDFQGSLSEYATTLVEMENDRIPGQSSSGGPSSLFDNENKKLAYKEDSSKRNEQRNTISRARKDMNNLDKSLPKLREKAANIQKEVDSCSSNEGWTVLAELTEKLQMANQEIEEKELRWMELAELVEEAEVEV